MIATPFALGLDHDAAATECESLFDAALERCVSDRAWPAKRPVFGVGHSLGAKLHADAAPSCGN